MADSLPIPLALSLAAAGIATVILAGGSGDGRRDARRIMGASAALGGAGLLLLALMEKM